MNILIVYATTEGQTLKIARFCASQCIAEGHSALVIRAEDATDLPLASFDAAILAGSVHMRHVQQALAEFAAEHSGSLSGMPSLFLMVSLSAATQEEDERAELEAIADAFCAAARWAPAKILQVAGAFRFGEYDFFKRWAMRWIASQNGQVVDPQGDTEYTDWQQLSVDLRAWLTQAEARV